MCTKFDTTVATHEGQRKVWKILVLYHFALESFYWRGRPWHMGVNVSTRLYPHLTPHELSIKGVSIGFHVYTTEVRAKKVLGYMGLYRGILRIVELTVDSDDFIAEDSRRKEAVYTKVVLSEDEYQKALGEAACV